MLGAMLVLRPARVCLFVAVAAALVATSLASGCTERTTSAPPLKDAAFPGIDVSEPDSSVADAQQDTSIPCSEIDAGLFGMGMSAEADGGPLPGNAPAVCSTAGVTMCPLVIVNNSGCAIETWWVDYTCLEEYYDTVPPGGMVTETTFVTHPWRIRIVGTRQLVKEIPAATDASSRTFTYP